MSERTGVWQAEVFGQTICYPAVSSPMLTLLPDAQRRPTGSPAASSSAMTDTLVMAGCDPAAGVLATQFAAATGLRLIVLERSSREAVDLLGRGLVHLAGLHLSTRESPNRNFDVVRDALGVDYQAIRLADWQSGVVSRSTADLRSLRSLSKSKLTWVGREPGSGARQCLDRILGKTFQPKLVARNHRQVVEAISAGWAEAGVCVQVTAVEAGLSFLPVQEESFDIVFPKSIADDHRIRSFVNVVRSSAYRKLLASLPGYDSGNSGTISRIFD
jgi:molybdate-binding protein